MYQFLRRALVAAATLPFLALPVTAHADGVTVPGCFGAASAIICDPTVEYVLPLDVTTYQTSVPVCAGSCYDIPVTLVRSNPVTNPHVCFSYADRSGNVTSTCQPLAAPSVQAHPCGYPYTGYVIEDGDGNTLLNACIDRTQIPSVKLVKCPPGEAGYYITYDGDTLLNLCFTITQ